MKKRYYELLDLDVYKEKLDNGLEIYVIPIKKFSKSYVQITAKYGSIHNNFKYKDSGEFKNMPAGIAHFLEHKLFEQENGEDPFDYFEKTSSDTNANTSRLKTSYLFYGRNNILENVDYLLDMVQSPYFTDENVSKEKGIIKEEARMYLNDPYSYLYDLSFENTFHYSEYRVPIIGTITSIDQITKEQLIECYETFYHPENMFMTISGNVDPKEVIERIKKNQSKKTFSKFKGYELLKKEEPNSVLVPRSEISLGLDYSIGIVNYKIDLKELSKVAEENNVDMKKVIPILMDIKFSNSSYFFQKIVDEDLTIGSHYDYHFFTEDHLIINFAFKTDKNVDILFDLIDKTLKEPIVDSKDFERKKKYKIAGISNLSGDIFSPNNHVISCVVKDGDINYNAFEELKSITFEKFLNVVSALTFENKSIVVGKK